MLFVMATILLSWRILKALMANIASPYGEYQSCYGEYRMSYGDNLNLLWRISPSSYGENYFVMADIVWVVEKVWREVYSNRKVT
jgi:hypothetical protein